MGQAYTCCTLRDTGKLPSQNIANFAQFINNSQYEGQNSTISEQKKAQGKKKELTYFQQLEKEWIKTLTPTHQVILIKFKQSLLNDGEKWSDWTLVRFLTARKWDIPETATMFQSFLKWRNEFGTDNILSFEYPELQLVKQYYPHGYHKTDKIGRPIYIERIGKINLTKLLEVTTLERFFKYYIKEYEILVKEKFEACSVGKGTFIGTSLCILDLNDVSLASVKQVYDFIKQTSQIAQNCYPEILGDMFIVNAPFLFAGIWKIIKPMLGQRTQQKIHILDSQFQAELLKVEIQNLPQFLGGTCSCYGGCLETQPGPWNAQEIQPQDIIQILSAPVESSFHKQEVEDWLSEAKDSKN